MMTKAKAFGTGLFSILLVYGSALAFGIRDHIGPTIAGIVGITLSYIGGNVADNGVKGAWYNPEMAKKPEEPAGEK